MKKLMLFVLAILCSMALLGGCASPALATDAGPSPSATVSAPAPTAIPTDTAAASPSPSGEQGGTDGVTLDGVTYYLDGEDAAAANYGEDAPLHMKKADGTDDKDLGVRGFNFDIIGEYIYIDSHDPDLTGRGDRTWSTTRLNKDGSAKVRLEYGSMSDRLVPEGGKAFYFTTMGDSAIYIADFACETVDTLNVSLPDKGELDKKLGANKILHVGIGEVKDGWITFDATFSNRDGIALYNGTYKITGDGTSISKVKGDYITSGAMENE